jgi:DNA gyrase/topoisomerase IV subunit A
MNKSEDIEIKRKDYSQEIDFVEAARMNIIRYSQETFRRAFPDYRDGIKPVARRILYAIWDMKSSDLIKVATIVGRTLPFHPHGDQSVNDAFVRLGQPWVMNYPLVTISGNLGSQDGDRAAAGRYIDGGLSDFAKFVIFEDLDKVSVNFEDNYDYTLKLPEYLPTKIPLALINGISGIGEAFMVELPPHNLNDIADICIKYVKDKSVSNEELVDGLFPDFPTGGEIINGNEIKEFYKLGKSTTIVVRGKADLIRETNTILLREFPYKVNIHDIEDQVIKENANGNMILQGIVTIQDDNGYTDEDDDDIEKGFSDKKKKNGRKKTYEYTCKKDSSMIEILQELYRSTNFQNSIPMSFIVNEEGKLKYVTIKNIVEDWYKIRVDTKRRKHTNAVAHLFNRRHVLEGVRSIYGIMDKVIKTIKENKSNKDSLIKTLHDAYGLTMVQAKGIYEMPLGTLSQFGKEELDKNIADLGAKIEENEKALNRIDEIIIDELMEVKKRFGRPRRTTVLLNVEEHKLGAITAKKGALLLSHGAIGLFDMNGVRDSKNIINGLKQTKVLGKSVRSIIGGKGLANETPIGFIVCYSDGTINRVSINSFKVINVWLHLTNTDSLITACTPIYDEDDTLVCLTVDKKLKRILVKDIPGTRRLQAGGPITETAQYNENDSEGYSHLLMVANNGTYSLIDIDEIPVVNRSAAGVKSSYDGYQGAISLLPLPEEILESERLFIGCTDNRDSQNYIMAYNPLLLKISGRVNKPKRLQIPEHYTISSIAMIDVGDKSGNICMIGKSSTATLSVTNFRKTYEPKRTFITPLVISLI